MPMLSEENGSLRCILTTLCLHEDGGVKGLSFLPPFSFFLFAGKGVTKAYYGDNGSF